MTASEKSCKDLGHALLNVDETKKDKEGSDVCGWRCGPKYSPCYLLQPCATPKWSLALFAISNFILSAILHGLLPVVISTLEKRFELRSTESGLIASMGDFGQCAVTFLCMFLPPRVDKPTVVGWGVAFGGLATIMFGLPHFTAPRYFYVDDEIFNYCGNVTDPDCSVSSLKNYLYWFVVCCFLIGAATAPSIIYGITYLDENVRKRDSTLYCALYYAIGGLGTAAGFIFGGMTLETYVYPLINPDKLTITSSDYSWVGAWWIGFVASGFLMISIAIPVFLLPKRLPDTEKHRSDRNSEAQKSHFEKSERNENKSGAVMIFSDICILLRNKPYMFMTFGVAMNYGLVFGFNTFGAKYLESVFGLTPFHSALLYGIAAIFASFIAQIASGLIVKRFDLQVIGILKYMIIAGILSAVCSVGFLMHCEDIEFAGGIVPYSDADEAIWLTSICNHNCSCNTDRYQPVCANGITYFSPCFAGCQTQLNETFFTDCSCVMDNSSRVNLDFVVSSETCDWKPCNNIILFMFVVFICFFTSILTMPTATQVTLRCVPFNKRDMALSFQNAFSCIGIICGRLLVGYVLDEACVAWRTECWQEGSCKIYRRKDIARNNTILLISQTTTCVIAYALVLFTYKPIKESLVDGSAPENIEVTQFGEEVESK